MPMKSCFSITLLFGISIAFWRSSYPLSSWGVLSLIPIFLFVFLGTFRNSLDRRRSVIFSTLRTDSSLLGLLTGTLISALAAFFVSTLSLSTVAVHALLASPIQITALLVIVAASTLIYSSLADKFKIHIRPLALSWFSAATTVFLVSILFFVPYAFVEWSAVERPGFIRLGFDEAMSEALGQLPRRGDMLNQAISAFQLVDSSKLWLASRFQGTMAPGALFAAHSALICIVASTSAVGAASFYRHQIEKRAWRQPDSAEGKKLTDDKEQNNGTQQAQKEDRQRKLFARSFWGTIIFLAVASLGLVAIGLLRSDQSTGDLREEPQPVHGEAAVQAVEIEPNTLQAVFERAASIARAETSDAIDPLLDELYEPVYGGVTSYADFHYTVLGEYTELVGAALGTAADAIEDRLYDGFDGRLERVANTLDARFADEFRTALMQKLQAEIPSELSGVPLAPITQRAIEDALARVRVTVPVGTVMATVGGAAAIKAVSAAIAAKVATKVAAKAAGKGVAKGTGILGGAGLGALGGSWAGPVGAAVGGAIGATVAWFAVDAAVITIDEYFSREDFEADLRVMIDEHRSVVRGHLTNALERKSEDMQKFTLKELSSE